MGIAEQIARAERVAKERKPKRQTVPEEARSVGRPSLNLGASFLIQLTFDQMIWLEAEQKRRHVPSRSALIRVLLAEIRAREAT